MQMLLLRWIVSSHWFENGWGLYIGVVIVLILSTYMAGFYPLWVVFTLQDTTFLGLNLKLHILNYISLLFSDYI